MASILSFIEKIFWNNSDAVIAETKNIFSILIFSF